MGSATCSFSERVNVLNGVASVVLKYAMHLEIGRASCRERV